MEAAVYEDIVGSLRARAWGDLDTMQQEMGREVPAVAAQSIRSILYQARSSGHLFTTMSTILYHLSSGVPTSREGHLQIRAQRRQQGRGVLQVMAVSFSVTLS